MPFMLNGIGTTYYGKRAFGQDGSYITTEFFVIGYFPIFPLRSRRVLETGEDSYFVVGGSTGYLAAPTMRIDAKQAFSVLGFVYGFFALWLSITFWPDPHAMILIYGPLLFGYICLPHILRRRSRLKLPPGEVLVREQ